MPIKKKTSSTSSDRLERFNLSRLNLQESYVSLALGALVVIVIAAVLFLLLRSANKGGVNLTNIKTVIEEQLGKKEESADAPKEEEYTVKEGDTLFEITQSKYGDGYKYLEVAMLNKISNPDQIEVGSKIKLPEKLESKSKTYTVKEGDSLWSISVATYGDGFRWAEITSLNNIPNPDYIWVGTELNLP